MTSSRCRRLTRQLHFGDNDVDSAARCAFMATTKKDSAARNGEMLHQNSASRFFLEGPSLAGYVP